MKPGFVITLGLLTAVAALTIDLSLPAIPAMAEALGTSLSHGQQIVGIFMAGMACGQIPAGLLSDRTGRMPILYVGLGIFTVAAMAAAIATSIELMLAARFVQGFGAAFSIVLSRAIVRDVSSGKDAARLMSLMTMIFTTAPVIAPSIGALLLTVWDWRMPFIVIAGCGFLMIASLRIYLYETHTPNKDGHPIRQLQQSFREYFSHRQSIFGLMLLVLPSAGFMSVIAISAALTVDLYGFSVQQYGLIFATAGLSILAGSAVNRQLVLHFEILTCIKIGVTLLAIAGVQMLLIAWLNAAPFWWLWSNVCVFMFTIAILMSNSTVLALDPLPKIAGVASSIIGTFSNVSSACGALLGAALYDGSVRNATITMGVIGVSVAVVYLMRPLICPSPIVHHPRELARD
jgi:DHA1 family bicyclomycin/chloramphenicol resistance-like MFS transporter